MRNVLMSALKSVLPWQRPENKPLNRLRLMEPLEDRQLLSMTIDLRLPGGGKQVAVSGKGQVINMELWVVVTGSDSTGSNDGFQSMMGSLLSSGSTKGTLGASLLSTFNTSGISSNGTSADLDGDGDSDLGSNDPTQATNYFIARHTDAFPFTGGTVSGNTQSIKVADVSFTVGTVGSSNTTINFRPRQTFNPDKPSNYDDEDTALWQEDGLTGSHTPDDGTLKLGAPVTLTVAAANTPPTASTGTFKPVLGTTSTTFTVTYSDNSAVSRSSINTGDIKVTGPNGFSQAASLVSVSSSSNGSPLTATYRVNAPGGRWDAIDNGNYAVALQANQVSDTNGAFAAATSKSTSISLAPAYLLNGALNVVGGNNADNITLAVSSGTMKVTVNGKTQSFSNTAIKSINVASYGGNDIITLGSGVRGSVVDGGAGNDTLNGGANGDKLLGGDGADRLNGNSGNDTLNGGSGNDVLSAGDGNDMLDGGTNADQLMGGSGNDTADYSSRNVALLVTLDNNANDGQAGEVDNVRTDVENVIGGSGNDKIIGNNLVNSLRGGNGNDTLMGGSANDILDGGNGIDSLLGQDGNDRLLARDSSADIVDGGGGKDAAQVNSTDKRISIESVLA